MYIARLTTSLLERISSWLRWLLLSAEHNLGISLSRVSDWFSLNSLGWIGLSVHTMSAIYRIFLMVDKILVLFVWTFSIHKSIQNVHFSPRLINIVNPISYLIYHDRIFRESAFLEAFLQSYSECWLSMTLYQQNERKKKKMFKRFCLIVAFTFRPENDVFRKFLIKIWQKSEKIGF